MSIDRSDIAGTLIDEVADAIVATSMDGVIQFWSQGAARLFGRPDAEALGRSIAELIGTPAHPDGMSSWAAVASRIAASGLFEACVVRGAAREVRASIAVRAIPETGTRPPLLVWSIREITAAEAPTSAPALRAQLEELLNVSPDAMLAVSPAGEIVLVNAHTERMFGYARGELIGRPVELLVPHRFQRAHEHHRSAYFQDLRTRPMGVGLALFGRRKDQTEIPVEISLSPLTIDDEQLAISAIRDVTEQKAATERVHEERTARANAEAAVQARTELLSVAAHELKTPITSLRVFVELLIRQVDSRGAVDPERLRLALATIDRQSSRLARLVDQMLDLSRIEVGRFGLTREPIDVMELVAMTVSAAQSTTSRHAVRIDGPASVIAELDGLRIEQVLTNLLDNAIKYSPAGGEIVVGVSRAGPDRVQVTVRDSGTGIPEESRSQIFDRFYRADGHDPASGMGLGLSIAREIVELHGGEIAVVCPPDGGACFTVTLPTGQQGDG